MSKKHKYLLISVIIAEIEQDLGYMSEQLTKEEVFSLAELVMRYYGLGWRDAMRQENPPQTN